MGLGSGQAYFSGGGQAVNLETARKELSRADKRYGEAKQTGNFVEQAAFNYGVAYGRYELLKEQEEA